MTEAEEKEMIIKMRSSAREWDEVDSLFQKLGREKSAALTKLVGTKFSNGFCIADEIALNIVRLQEPDKMKMGASKFTIETVDGITMIIAMDKEGKVLYCVEMPVENEYAPESSGVEFSIEDAKINSKKLKVMNTISYIIVGICVVGALVFLYVNN